MACKKGITDTAGITEGSPSTSSRANGVGAERLEGDNTMGVHGGEEVSEVTLAGLGEAWGSKKHTEGGRVTSYSNGVGATGT